MVISAQWELVLGNSFGYTALSAFGMSPVKTHTIQKTDQTIQASSTVALVQSSHQSSA
jgi:succinate-acetate transporter protein